jgi:hypothetical protein
MFIHRARHIGPVNESVPKVTDKYGKDRIKKLKQEARDDSGAAKDSGARLAGLKIPEGQWQHIPWTFECFAAQCPAHFDQTKVKETSPQSSRCPNESLSMALLSAPSQMRKGGTKCQDMES